MHIDIGRGPLKSETTKAAAALGNKIITLNGQKNKMNSVSVVSITSNISFVLAVGSMFPFHKYLQNMHIVLRTHEHINLHAYKHGYMPFSIARAN